MGGKSYYCDYCRCYLKNDVNVRKVHNSGLSHTIAKATYMKRYEDPRKLLADEMAKAPCSRYWKGYCKFDLFCQYSHYNSKQLHQLQLIVNKMQQKSLKLKSKVASTEQSQLKQQQRLPWQTPKYEAIMKKQKHLPPSLKPINLSKMIKHNFEGNSWG